MTPLGERSTKARWYRAIAAYGFGATLGGAALGGASGLFGWAILRDVASTPLIAALGVALLVGLVLDLRVTRLTLPSWRRQVNREWMYEYREPVWAFSFGVQLGAGVVTVVTTSTVYATFVSAILTGSPFAGTLIGGLFGASRGIAMFLVARTRDAEALARLHRALLARADLSRRLTLVVQVSIVIWLAAYVFISYAKGGIS